MHLAYYLSEIMAHSSLDQYHRDLEMIKIAHE